MRRQVVVAACAVLAVWLASAGRASAQTAQVVGSVRDETGGVLPGVSVALRSGASVARQYVTDAQGSYRFGHVPAGRAQLSFGLVNFASARRDVTAPASGWTW